jgi:hypothetical protein
VARFLSVLTFMVAVVLVDVGSAEAQSWNRRGSDSLHVGGGGKKSRVIKRPKMKVPELGASGALAALSLVGGAAAVAHGRRRKRA